MPDKFACDTSVIFNGQILKFLEDNELGECPEIYISNIVIAEGERRLGNKVSSNENIPPTFSTR